VGRLRVLWRLKDTRRRRPGGRMNDRRNDPLMGGGAHEL